MWLLRCFGAKIGKHVYISNRAVFVHPWNIHIGNYVGIDDYAYIKGDALIDIHDYVSIGAYAKLLPSGHDVRSRNFKHIGSPITVKNGAFIGADVFVGPGVTIGKMTVVGSRTNLYKNVGDNTVVIQDVHYVTKERLSLDVYQQYQY